MDRRTFATLAAVAFVDTLFARRLFAAPARLNAARWLREVQTLCRDLRAETLTASQWQTQIRALHDRFGVDELTKLIDLDAVAAGFEYPERGVVTKDPPLPKLAGGYAFIARMFGMAKGRAIIPHGHRNMVSAHRVIGGEFRLRMYDRVKSDDGHLWLRPSVDETARRGSTSAITGTRDNVHWLVANTERAFTFDVIVVELGGRTGIDNLDIERAERDGDLLRVPTLGVADALAKYG